MRTIKWDIVAWLGFTLVAGLAYIAWYAVNYDRLICYLSALVIVAGLGIWLKWLWSRLRLWLTRFFCLAAAFDLLLEGFVHPFHPETLVEKLTCQLMMFGVYAVYLGLLRPLDLWLARRRA